jgi:NADH-ubiquinone oxidoreductase chain 6
LLSILLRNAYIISSHPVLLMTLILSQAVLICLIAWLKLKISWFSYILFLVFLGGLMVLFIYIVRLASNEKINTSIFSNKIIILFALGLILFIGWIQLNSSNLRHLREKSSNIIFNIYSVPIRITTIIVIVYLLFTLTVVVRVASKYRAPIKNLIF